MSSATSHCKRGS